MIISLNELKQFCGVSLIDYSNDILFSAALQSAQNRAQIYVGKSNLLVQGTAPAWQFFGDNSGWLPFPARILPVITSLSSRNASSVTASDYAAIATTLYELSQIEGAWILRYPNAFVGGLLYEAIYTCGCPQVNEVHTLNATGSSGTFTATYWGIASGAIPYNATAAQVLAALSAITFPNTSGKLLQNNIFVTGGPLPAPITITYINQLAALPIPLPVIDNTSMVSGSAIITEATAGVPVYEDIKEAVKWCGAHTILSQGSAPGGLQATIWKTISQNLGNGQTMTKSPMELEDLAWRWKQLLDPYRIVPV